MSGSILHFMSMSSFATCRKPRYRYFFHLGTANTPGHRPTLKYKASMYIYIYTDIHLFVVPKKYAWHKHLEAS